MEAKEEDAAAAAEAAAVMAVCGGGGDGGGASWFFWCTPAKRTSTIVFSQNQVEWSSGMLLTVKIYFL